MNQSTTIFYLDGSGVVYPIDVTTEIFEQLTAKNEINSMCLNMPNIDPYPAYHSMLVMNRHLFESERAAVARHQSLLCERIAFQLNRSAITFEVTDHLRDMLTRVTNTTTLYQFERKLGFYTISRVEVPTMLVSYISNARLMVALGLMTPLFTSYQQVTDAIVEDYLVNQELRREYDLPAVELLTFNSWE